MAAASVDDVHALQDTLLDGTIEALCERCSDATDATVDGGVAMGLRGTQATSEALLCMFYNDADSMEGQAVQYALQRPDALILGCPAVFQEGGTHTHTGMAHATPRGSRPMQPLPPPTSAALSADVAQIALVLAAFPEHLWAVPGGPTTAASDADVARIAASAVVSAGWRAFAVVHATDALTFSTQQQQHQTAITASSAVATATGRRVLTLRKPSAAEHPASTAHAPPPVTALDLLLSQPFACAVVRFLAALGGESARLSGALNCLRQTELDPSVAEVHHVQMFRSSCSATSAAASAQGSKRTTSIVAAPPAFLSGLLPRMPHRSAPPPTRDGLRDQQDDGGAAVGGGGHDAPHHRSLHFCAVLVSYAVLRYIAQLCAAVGLWPLSNEGARAPHGTQHSSAAHPTAAANSSAPFAVASQCIVALTKTMQFCPGWFVCAHGLDGLVPMLRFMVDALHDHRATTPPPCAALADDAAQQCEAATGDDKRPPAGAVVARIGGDVLAWLTAAV